VDVTGSGSCPVAGFCISGVDPSFLLPDSYLYLCFFVFVHISVQVMDTEGDEASSEVVPTWRLVGRLLDRISFLAFSVIYFILLIAYYLYYV